jgi:hypothetical protein
MTARSSDRHLSGVGERVCEVSLRRVLVTLVVKPLGGWLFGCDDSDGEIEDLQRFALRILRIFLAFNDIVTPACSRGFAKQT